MIDALAERPGETAILVDYDGSLAPIVGLPDEAVAAAADEADARLPGVIVERKSGVSVTLHWRTRPERAEQVIAVAADLARRYGLAELPTRSAIELRPPVAID